MILTYSEYVPVLLRTMRDLSIKFTPKLVILRPHESPCNFARKGRFLHIFHRPAMGVSKEDVEGALTSAMKPTHLVILFLLGVM